MNTRFDPPEQTLREQTLQWRPAECLPLLLRQREALLHADPSLAAFFVPVLHAPSGVTLPFLPLRAFRLCSLFAAPLPVARTFKSSGSTQSVRASHSFSHSAIATYASGARQGFKLFLDRFGLSYKTPMISLVPPEQLWPESSLAAMMSMLATDPELNLTFVDIESNPQEFFDTFARSEFSRCVVFGTSFHHVTLAEFARTQGQATPHELVAVVDTGGTKGRTQSFTTAEVSRLAGLAYGPADTFLFLSEYGMCELASQAYSAAAPHNGTFVCNPTLSVFAVNLNTQTFCAPGEKGFLAFLDTHNVDSYAAVLTEDLGTIPPSVQAGTHLDHQSDQQSDQQSGHHSDHQFVLETRAPDASLKGCSLNVRRNFFFLDNGSASAAQSTNPTGTPPAQKKASTLHTHLPRTVNMERLIANLAPEHWDVFAREDLRQSLATWQNAPPDFSKQILTHYTKALHKHPLCRVAIVASANIPIAWLHAAGIAAVLGAEHLDLYLPSLRLDDPLSERVRLQIQSLAKALATEFSHQPSAPQLTVFDSSLPPSATGFSHMVVFGSNETVATLSAQYAHSHLRIIGLGDVRNCISLTSTTQESLKDAAEKCALWMGRGCLTPVAVFLSEPHEAPAFSLALEAAFAKRMQGAGVSGHFFHKHALLEAQWRLARAGTGSSREEQIANGAYSLVINASRLTLPQLKSAEFDVESGGMGFVTLLPKSASGLALYSNLQSLSTTPGLWQQHNGKLWIDWFLGTLD